MKHNLHLHPVEDAAYKLPNSTVKTWKLLKEQETTFDDLKKKKIETTEL